mgnify:CR=1 FL=1
MARNYTEQNAVRQYLLKQLSEAEQQAFELRLLTDDALPEELEIVEDELIDEYLANELSEDERVSFEETFLAHPERQRKLKGGRNSGDNARAEGDQQGEGESPPVYANFAVAGKVA